MEKQRATIKFKAAARIARVTHGMSTNIRSINSTTEAIEETEEGIE